MKKLFTTADEARDFGKEKLKEAIVSLDEAAIGLAKATNPDMYGADTWSSDYYNTLQTVRIEAIEMYYKLSSFLSTL